MTDRLTAIFWYLAQKHRRHLVSYGLYDWQKLPHVRSRKYGVKHLALFLVLFPRRSEKTFSEHQQIAAVIEGEVVTSEPWTEDALNEGVGDTIRVLSLAKNMLKRNRIRHI